MVLSGQCNFHLITDNTHRDRFQCIALAGAGHAETVVDAEPGAVCGALDEFTAAVQEPVRDPVQIDPGMRATIPVRHWTFRGRDKKNGMDLITPAHFKSTPPGGQIRQPAKAVEFRAGV